MLFNTCETQQKWNYSKVWKGGRFLQPGSCRAQVRHLHLPDLWGCVSWKGMWEDASIWSSRGSWPSAAPLLLLRNVYSRQWNNCLNSRRRLFWLLSQRNSKFNEYPLSIQSIQLCPNKAVCKAQHGFPIHVYSSREVNLQQSWALS